MEDNDIFEKEPRWEPDGEIRAIQKTIRRRNWKIISTSVVLAAVLLAVSVFGIIPWAESLYWNPDETTYKDRTDLEITMNAYTELFTPGYDTSFVTDHRTGFASYELEIRLVSTAQDEVFIARGSLERNDLHLDYLFEKPEGKNYVISDWRLPVSAPTPSETEALRERLRTLSDYIRLEAAVSFTEDLSMEELLNFWRDAQELSMDITWVAVRSMELTDEWTPVCGMNFGGGTYYPLVDLDYRCFNGPAAMNAESLEHHFMSLLQYSADQVEKGRGIAPYGEEGLYADILDYVKENGVETYGVVVTASPQVLLELMDHDLVRNIRLIDGWIDIG